MVEIWKQVPGWPEYEASDQGQIRRNGKILKKANHAGRQYPAVALCRLGKPKTLTVHSIVLETFRGPRPFPKAEGRHLNGLKFDNSLDNLVWGSHEENCLDKKLHGTQCFGEGIGTSKLTEAHVLEIRARRQRGELLKDIAKSYSISQEHAYKICIGRAWSHTSEGEIRKRSPKRGETNIQAKLTTALVLDMRRLRSLGTGVYVLASQFNVSPSSVSRICSGKGWGHTF